MILVSVVRHYLFNASSSTLADRECEKHRYDHLRLGRPAIIVVLFCMRRTQRTEVQWVNYEEKVQQIEVNVTEALERLSMDAHSAAIWQIQPAIAASLPVMICDIMGLQVVQRSGVIVRISYISSRKQKCVCWPDVLGLQQMK